MIELKPFRITDWTKLKRWIKNEKELVQFAGPIFDYPVSKNQVENYLSEPKRIVFKIDVENRTVGIAEIFKKDRDVAKLARILIGRKSMRGKGIGTKLINKLTEFSFYELKKNRILLNVYSWNIEAIKCYEKAGYSKTDKEPIKTFVGNEEWEIIEMEKSIETNN